MLYYEGSDLVVHHLAGNTDIVCITFPPLGFTHEALTNFFAATPLSKAGISAIGIMTKRDHWFYPENTTEVDDVVSAVTEIAARYRKVVIFAASMGAHGALKFASRFGADAVLSLGPKWSIDPELIPPIPERWIQDNFRPWMRRTAITPEDITGVKRVYLGYDPQDELDARHAAKIIEMMPDVIPIYFNHSGHYLPTVLSGTGNLSRIVHGLAELEPTAFIKAIHDIRRHHPNMLRITATRGGERFPYLSLGIMNALRSGKIPNGEKVSDDQYALAKIMFSLRNDPVAISNCLNLIDDQRRPASLANLGRGSSETAETFNLMGIHGWVVSYDLRSESLVSTHPSNLDSYTLAIRISRNDYTMSPYVELMGEKFFLCVSSEKIILSRSSNNSFRVIESTNAAWSSRRFSGDAMARTFLLASSCGFISVSPEGDIDYSDRDLHWEAMIAIPASEGFRIGLENPDNVASAL